MTKFVKYMLLEDRDYEELSRLCKMHALYKDTEGEKLRALIRMISYKLDIKNFPMNYTEPNHER